MASGSGKLSFLPLLFTFHLLIFMEIKTNCALFVFSACLFLILWLSTQFNEVLCSKQLRNSEAVYLVLHNMLGMTIPHVDSGNV